MFEQPHHPPQGALRQSDGSVAWCVWAPHAEEVILWRWPEGEPTQTIMQPLGFGYHRCTAAPAAEGLRYAYQLADGKRYPDPASRWQPEGVHAPSALYFPDEFPWHDAAWKGVAREDLIIYELHVGTFTEEGTFAAVIPRLPDLKALGVTAIELMPVGQFAGERNWGYDGVYPFAVQHSYGGPRGLQSLVDAAHRCGLAVLLDVVYNHLGPEGNYLPQFGPYFTDHYHTPWGKAVNFDGPQCDPVRRYVIDNARMWIRDFHVDGLRLDAVHAIFDFSARHILAELQQEVQEEAARLGRTVHVIAESNQNDVRLVDPPDRGGFGLDGLWSDDFHHSVRTLLTGEREGYYQDFGAPQHLVKAYNEVFVYDGCYSPFRRRNHGSKAVDRDRSQFVVCVHNHDQIGNRALGDRSASYLPPAAQRLAGGLLLLSPCTPLLFMGEEYAEARPFPFFCSFGDEELAEAVRRGRREEFAALEFHWGADIPDPQAPETFASARLGWQWPPGSHEAAMRRLYGALLQARRNWPPLRDRRHTQARWAPAAVAAKAAASSGTKEWPEDGVLLLERGPAAERLLAAANLTARTQCLPAGAGGDRSLTAIFSTEQPEYGGSRRLADAVESLHPYELVLFGKKEWLG